MWGQSVCSIKYTLITKTRLRSMEVITYQFFSSVIAFSPQLPCLHAYCPVSQKHKHYATLYHRSSHVANRRLGGSKRACISSKTFPLLKTLQHLERIWYGGLPYATNLVHGFQFEPSLLGVRDNIWQFKKHWTSTTRSIFIPKINLQAYDLNVLGIQANFK